MQDRVEAAPTTSRRWRRGLIFGVALTALCAVIWNLSAELVEGGLVNPHGREVQELNAGSIANDVQGVADLHGHLNYAVWGRGQLDHPQFLATAERTIELTEDRVVTTLLKEAIESVQAGKLRTAHDQVERAEGRLAQLEHRPDS
jgi:hypothetical protein